MSYAELKKNLKSLPLRQRKELVSYLVHLEQSEDQDFINRITRKIDDSDKFTKWSDIKKDF